MFGCENASLVLRNFAFERKGGGCQRQKVANVPLECAKRAQSAQTGALMEASLRSWEGAEHMLRGGGSSSSMQPAVRMDAHS